MEKRSVQSVLRDCHVLSIDYKQSKKNALLMQHDECYEVCKQEMQRTMDRSIRIEPNPNRQSIKSNQAQTLN